MSTNKIQRSSSNSALPPLDPIAQLVMKYESNGHQSAAIQSSLPPREKKRTWTGFSDKTLWDWLNLSAALLVPLMIAVFTLVTNIQQTQISQRQHDTDIQIAGDQQREAILKTYIDDMTDLLLNHHLRNAQPNDELIVIAQVKTLITLKRLDPVRKATVVQFLADSNLVGKEDVRSDQFTSPLFFLDDTDLTGVNLSGADLSGVYLRGAHLTGANLSQSSLSFTEVEKADLSSADLEGAFMNGTFLSNATLTRADLHNAVLSLADLEGADLTNANLQGADLEEANLTNARVTKEQLAQALTLKGATLPDGSIYPSQSYPIPHHKEPTSTPIPPPPAGP
jgi:uncharacterized protein YjbI with pentapeptide repeats